jgi:hypothetical protein
MANPYSGQIFSELVSGNLFQADQITGPFICIVGTASSGPSYTLKRISSAQEAATLFEEDGDTDTPFLRDIALALQEGGEAITLYAMRIGGTQGSLLFTQSASTATLKITPQYEDAEAFEKYKIALMESTLTAGTQRILIYDDDLDAVIFDSDLIIVPDLGLVKVELSESWDGHYEFGLDTNSQPDFEGTAPTLKELHQDPGSYFSATNHSGTDTAALTTKVDPTDGKNLSKPAQYACLEKAYGLISTRYMDFIVPSGVYFDAPNITDTTDGRDISQANASQKVYTSANIDWSDATAIEGDSTKDLLGYLWQYKYKGTKYSFMTHAADLFTGTASGTAYINQNSSDVVSTELEVLDTDLKTLLDALHAAISGVSTNQADVATELTNFDTTNSATYGTLFADVSTVSGAVSLGDAKTAAYTLVNAIRLNVGLEITLAARAKFLTFEDANGEYHKVKNLKILVKQSATDEDGASLSTGTAELGDLEATEWNSATGLLTVQVLFNSTEAAAVNGTSVPVGDVTLGTIKTALEASDYIDSVAYTAASAQVGVTYADADLVYPTIGVSGSDVDTNSGDIAVGQFWLTHEELTGEEIPSRVWSKLIDEGSNTQLREINFAHQLAQFCYYASSSYHMCLGFISFSKPDSFNKIDLANFMGALPEYQGWGGKLTDEAIKSVGEGILGNKFLGGSIGYRGNELKGGSASQGYAFGGLVCTKGLSLPNKEPYGIAQGDEKKDVNKFPVDIGRHIVVSASWPICSFSLSGTTIAARHSIPALLAAKVFVTPVNQEPFGEVNGAVRANVLLSDAEQQLVADGYAGDCRIARITMLDSAAIGGSNYITSISTAAHWKDDYKRISTIRCVNRVVNGLRNLAKRYIGSSFSSAMITSLQSAINGYLKSEQDVGVHQGAIATLSYTRADRINGNLKITLKMVPPFALETITITTSVAADASEL